MTTVETTDTALAAAFAEWHRRWTEEPDRFQSETECLAQPDDDYGVSCTRYLLAILAEQEAA